jgi:hypothetical protein
LDVELVLNATWDSDGAIAVSSWLILCA